METTVIVCLSGIVLAAALVGLILLLPKSVRRENEATAKIEKAVPVCQTAEVSGSKVRNYHYPVPEELEESVPCIESPGSGPLDDRMSDIEAAIGDSCRGDVLRHVLVSLIKSGMRVVNSDGTALSPEDIMSLRDDDEPVPHKEKASVRALNPATQKKPRRKPGRLGGALNRLDSEFRTKETIS